MQSVQELESNVLLSKKVSDCFESLSPKAHRTPLAWKAPEYTAPVLMSKSLFVIELHSFQVVFIQRT